jgi:hypothetical protein
MAILGRLCSGYGVLTNKDKKSAGEKQILSIKTLPLTR